MRTFNIDLWQTLREKTKPVGGASNSLLNGNVFFGIAPAQTATPYCVMHVLDSGNDVNSQTLCKKDENYNSVGISDIQFSIYATNDMAIDEIAQELNKLIDSLQNLTEYRIISLSVNEQKMLQVLQMKQAWALPNTALSTKTFNCCKNYNLGL